MANNGEKKGGETAATGTSARPANVDPRSLHGRYLPDGRQVLILPDAEVDAIGGLMHLRYGANVPHSVVPSYDRNLLNPNFVDKEGEEKGKKKEDEDMKDVKKDEKK